MHLVEVMAETHHISRTKKDNKKSKSKRKNLVKHYDVNPTLTVLQLYTSTRPKYWRSFENYTYNILILQHYFMSLLLCLFDNASFSLLFFFSKMVLWVKVALHDRLLFYVSSQISAINCLGWNVYVGVRSNLNITSCKHCGIISPFTM